MGGGGDGSVYSSLVPVIEPGRTARWLVGPGISARLKVVGWLVGGLVVFARRRLVHVVGGVWCGNGGGGGAVCDGAIRCGGPHAHSRTNRAPPWSGGSGAAHSVVLRFTLRVLVLPLGRIMGRVRPLLYSPPGTRPWLSSW